MVNSSEYKVGVVLTLEDCGKSRGRTLKACTVNVEDESKPVTVVTSANNVRVGSRVAVALVGSSFVNEEGGESMVSKSAVGGVMSEGMLCDSRMLGWVGGAAGIAVLIDESIKIGSAPRATRLRHKQEEKNILQGDEEVKGLFEKKLTKEERKMFAEEKRNARKDERLQKRQRRMMDAEA